MRRAVVEGDVRNELTCNSTYGLQASVEVTHVLERGSPQQLRLPEVFSDTHLVNAFSCPWVHNVDCAVVDEIDAISLLVILISVSVSELLELPLDCRWRLLLSFATLIEIKPLDFFLIRLKL